MFYPSTGIANAAGSPVFDPLRDAAIKDQEDVIRMSSFYLQFGKMI